MGECGPHCRNRAWMEESRCTTATDEATTTRFGARGKRSAPAMHVPQPLGWSTHAPGFFFSRQVYTNLGHGRFLYGKNMGLSSRNTNWAGYPLGPFGSGPAPIDVPHAQGYAVHTTRQSFFTKVGKLFLQAEIRDGAKTPPAKTITGEELGLHLRRSVIASGACDNHIHIRPPPAIISGECRRLRRLVLAGARYVFRLRKQRWIVIFLPKLYSFYLVFLSPKAQRR